jgi:gliding motility-associated-like protein
MNTAYSINTSIIAPPTIAVASTTIIRGSGTVAGDIVDIYFTPVTTTCTATDVYNAATLFKSVVATASGWQYVGAVPAGKTVIVARTNSVNSTSSFSSSMAVVGCIPPAVLPNAGPDVSFSFGVTDSLTGSAYSAPYSPTWLFVDPLPAGAFPSGANAQTYYLYSMPVGASIRVEYTLQSPNCYYSDTVRLTIINKPPVTTVAIGPNTKQGAITAVDAASLISDPENNLDINTFAIYRQPVSKAKVTTYPAFPGLVMFDYSDNFNSQNFSGYDSLIYKICDNLGACSYGVIRVFVEPNAAENPKDIYVYNAVSPNGDGKHDNLEILNILDWQHNRVSVYNRWGDKVWEGTNYDNHDIVFDGRGNQGSHNNIELPDGTYYYVVVNLDGDINGVEKSISRNILQLSR